MKKIYNKDTLRDMPIEDSFSPAENAKSTSSKTTASKPKINVIGKKSTGSTTASKGKSTAKSTTLTRTKEKDTTKPSKGPIKKLNTRKSSVETTSPTAEETKKTSTRTKLANTQQELSDLEKLNEDNLKTYRYKSKRKTTENDRDMELVKPKNPRSGFSKGVRPWLKSRMGILLCL